ncbi:MAG: hypothetical protein ABIQ60_01555 [Burkholderiaceae bacterium]
MNRTLSIVGWMTLAGLVLAVAAVAGATAVIGSFDAPRIEINGEPIVLASLSFGQTLAATAAVALALLVVVLVVPIAVLVPLLIAGWLVVGALALTVGTLALVFSPLLMFVALVWLAVRLLRPDRDRAPTVEPAGRDARIAG